MVRVGIVGHRWFTDATSARFVAHQCERILRCGRDRHDDLAAVSAAAAGADTLFAEAALALDVPLELVRPFRGYLGDFSECRRAVPLSRDPGCCELRDPTSFPLPIAAGLRGRYEVDD